MKAEDTLFLDHVKTRQKIRIRSQLALLLAQPLVEIVVSFVEFFDVKTAVFVPFYLEVNIPEQRSTKSVLERACTLSNGVVLLPGWRCLTLLDVEERQKTKIVIDGCVQEAKVFDGEIHLIVMRGLERWWQVLAPPFYGKLQSLFSTHEHCFLVSRSLLLCSTSEDCWLVERGTFAVTPLEASIHSFPLYTRLQFALDGPLLFLSTGGSVGVWHIEAKTWSVLFSRGSCEYDLVIGLELARLDDARHLLLLHLILGREFSHVTLTLDRAEIVDAHVCRMRRKAACLLPDAAVIVLVGATLHNQRTQKQIYCEELNVFNCTMHHLSQNLVLVHQSKCDRRRSAGRSVIVSLTSGYAVDFEHPCEQQPLFFAKLRNGGVLLMNCEQGVLCI